MPDTISATGVVGTPPEFAIVGSGLARLTFRLASTQRKFNREASGWENGETNWYTVVAFRRLAENSSHSLSKGDRVVVTGRLRVNEWERDGRRGTAVEVIADGIGHDLTFGTTSYSKTSAASTARGIAPASSTAPLAGNAPAAGIVPASGAAPADDTGSPESPVPVAAVDSGGWALPGGADDGGEGDETASSDNAQDNAEAEDEQVAQLEFAVAEPPF